MSNNKFTPRFVSMPITYCVVLDGISILTTKDFSLGVECCLSWRKNNPHSNPARICLTDRAYEEGSCGM